MAAAGMHPMATMPHSRHVPRFSGAVLRGEKGFSLWKYKMSTAMMAPSWMTTKNSSRNSGDTFSFTNSSTRIICPVEEIGSHSVMPSTTPMKNAFRISMNISMGTLAPFQSRFRSQPRAGRPILRPHSGASPQNPSMNGQASLHFPRKSTFGQPHGHGSTPDPPRRALCALAAFSPYEAAFRAQAAPFLPSKRVRAPQHPRLRPSRGPFLYGNLAAG